MWKTVVAPNETPALLSTRAGVPVCAILRANRLFSPAWLLPVPEIDARWRLRTILPGEAPALTLSERAVNALWGAAYPGMKMLFFTGD